MGEERDNKTPIWVELYRRRVFGVAVTYAIVAWGLIEVASVALPAFDAPQWILRALIIIAIVGCPIAIGLSWVFDITPKGLRRTVAVPDVVDTPAVEEAQPEYKPDEPAAPERRQVCVLCCDFTSHLADGQAPDPEELLEAIPKYLGLCEKVIAESEGQMSVTATDDVIAYFGADFGHEDDAIRAVRSALAVRDGTESLSRELDQTRNLQVSVRMGIHTGLVVAEDASGGSDDRSISIVGQAPKIAASIQAIAENGEVLISTPTYNLVSAFFDCEDAGEISVAGAASERLYRVLGESVARSRLESTRVTDLFGREQELALLKQRWEQAKDGSGQAVVIRGEPGIGKSRITLAIEDHVREDSDVWLVFCYCSSYHENSALYPILEWMRHDVLMLNDDLTPEQSIGRLEAFLEAINNEEYPLTETVPVFAPLLSLALTDKYTQPQGTADEQEAGSPPQQRTPDEQKEFLLRAIMHVILERAQEQPVLLVAEDLHWADPTTRDFFTILLDHMPRSPILAILTARDNFMPPWPFKSYISDLTIGRLSAEQSRELAEALVRDRDLPDIVSQQIIDKTDGVPLFVQELTRSVVESGMLENTARLKSVSLPIPSSLTEFLTARIDRLGTAKSLAQLAAAIGRDFDHALLSAIVNVDKKELQWQLSQLIAAEFIYKQGIGSKARYSFRHALFQETAYGSLLKSRRQEYHQRIADSLEADFPETCEAHPAVLARHFSEAGVVRKAIDYWQSAGAQAASLSAGMEAAHHFRNGLDNVNKLPDDADKAAIELDLQVGLGRAIISSEGYSVQDVKATFMRALELCGRIGETPLILDVLFGLWAYNATRGATSESLAFAEQVRGIGELSDNDDVIIEGDLITAVSLFQSADFEQCRRFLDRVAERHDPVKHAVHAILFGQEPGMSCNCYDAILTWTIGYADQAVHLAEKVFGELNDERNPQHMHNRAFVLFHLARFYADYGDIEKTEALTTECISLSGRPNLGFKTWLAYGHMVHGWAIHQRGEQADGLAEMAEGLAQATEIEVGSSLTRFLSAYAECCLESGDIDQALELLQRGYDFIDKFGNQAEQTELYRVHAEILIQQGGENRKQAHKLLKKALDMAQERNARAYQLRASISLAKLLQLEGDTQRAQKLLTSDIEWFGNGNQSRDYEQATELLQQIAH